MISNYRNLMEKMYKTADKDYEVQNIRNTIKKILEEIEMLSDVYEGESHQKVRSIIKMDLESQIKNYAKIGSKILGTQIQYFTRQYLEENKKISRSLFDKYKSNNSKKLIGDPYPFEIKKASRLFMREIVNAMNIDEIEKSYDKLDEFIDVSDEYFEKKLKSSYIQLLKMAGDFFNRYDFLESYCSDYDKNMEELNVTGIKYVTKSSTKNKELISVEDTFSQEYLEKLDIYTIMSLNAFWQNRMAKDSKRIYTAFYIIDRLNLLKEDKIQNSDDISDELLKELIARKIFINRLATFKLRNYIDGTENYDSSLIDRIEVYSKNYNEDYNTNLEQEIDSIEYEQVNNENIYLIKNQNLSYLVKMLCNEKSKIPNWGIVPENSDEIYTLISIDLPGYNMPISLHIPKDILITSLYSLNTDKSVLNKTFIIPVYEGHQDFEINHKYIPTNILMPLNKEQKKELFKNANSIECTDKTYNLMQHLYANSKGEVASHLKQTEIKNGITYLKRKRKYYDLIEEKFYETDTKGNYVEFDGGHTDSGR